MTKRFWKAVLLVAVVAVSCMVALIYLWPSSGPSVITSEQDARASCLVALKSHLRDVKKENEKWVIASVRFDSSTDRWLCTLAKGEGHRLFIILNPKTGDFEVSASSG